MGQAGKHGAAAPATAVVGIAGAGVMGKGIAALAAAAGHPVLLYDAAPGAGVVRALADLAPCALVIEAIVEDLAAKRELLSALERIVAPDAILASNTSSLSIAELARGLARPERFAGMHFFNPARAMKLVEIVRGPKTAEQTVAFLLATAAAWGKTPVRVRDAPGFIVNRVARPFYLEALSLYENHAADPATIDAIVRDCGGFRMGPFELMDLIGHDVNLAVTRSVFEAFARAPRFAPSRAQGHLVASGRLGKKSGRGIYDYRPGAADPSPQELPPGPKPSRVTIEGDLGPAESLAETIAASGIPCARRPGDGCVVVDGATLMPTDGRTAARRVAEGAPGDLVLFDLAFDYMRASRIGLAAGASVPESALAAAAGLIQALGKKASPLPDAPALAVLRIVARIADEAASAVADGIADPAAVDTAMLLGANYPLGPLAWANTIGPERIRTALAALAEAAITRA